MDPALQQRFGIGTLNPAMLQQQLGQAWSLPLGQGTLGDLLMHLFGGGTGMSASPSAGPGAAAASGSALAAPGLPAQPPSTDATGGDVQLPDVTVPGAGSMYPTATAGSLAGNIGPGRYPQLGG